MYCDDGYSGTNFDRPDFQRMIRDIEAKKVNMVIVKDSSRLGRDYIQFGEYIEKYFPQNKVRVISILDNYDSEIDNGVADTLPFRAVMNDFYAKDTSKKVRSTKQKNAKQGLFMGRYAPFGYDKSKEDKHKLVVNEEQAAIVKKIYEMYRGGKGLQVIAQTLEKEGYVTSMGRTKWHPGTIKHILENPFYCGTIVYKKNYVDDYLTQKKKVNRGEIEQIVIEGKHEPIISKELFNEVQKIIESKKRFEGQKGCMQNTTKALWLLFCKLNYSPFCILFDGDFHQAA